MCTVKCVYHAINKSPFKPCLVYVVVVKLTLIVFILLTGTTYAFKSKYVYVKAPIKVILSQWGPVSVTHGCHLTTAKLDKLRDIWCYKTNFITILGIITFKISSNYKLLVKNIETLCAIATDSKQNPISLSFNQ